MELTCFNLNFDLIDSELFFDVQTSSAERGGEEILYATASEGVLLYTHSLIFNLSSVRLLYL